MCISPKGTCSSRMKLFRGPISAFFKQSQPITLFALEGCLLPSKTNWCCWNHKANTSFIKELPTLQNCHVILSWPAQFLPQIFYFPFCQWVWKAEVGRSKTDASLLVAVKKHCVVGNCFTHLFFSSTSAIMSQILFSAFVQWQRILSLVWNT